MRYENKIIKINNLNFRYADSSYKALNHINLTITNNQWVSIIGKNGSGKSTLVKLLVGLLESENKGSIQIMGKILNNETINNIRNNIGIIFQNPDNQFIGGTVAEDIAFELENQGINRYKMNIIINQSLKAVGMLDYYHYPPQDLSDGQKQRVALAGAIAIHPQIIILDEATSMLDPIGKKELINIIKDLKQVYGLTILSITHDMNEASMADQLLIMDKGTIIKSGTVKNILTNDKLLKQVNLDVPLNWKIQNYIQNIGYDIKSNQLLDEEGLINILCQLS